MRGDINQSATASAEANGVKLSGNTVNISLSSGGGPESPGTLARIVRLVNPVYYEKREADARAIRVDSVMSSMKRLCEEFPNMSERRAVMEAMGYRMTNEQADNVVEVLSEAQANLDAQGEEAKGLLPESRDAIIEGSKSAYDEDVRSIWARLVADETAKPDTFSKRTMSILSQMNSSEAQAFSRICSYAVEMYVSNAEEAKYFDPLLVLRLDDDGHAYNQGGVRLNDVSMCRSLGLVDTYVYRTIHLIPDLPATAFKVSDRLLGVSARGESNAAVRFSGFFLDAGKELASICGIGNAENAADLFEEFAIDQGLKVSDELRQDWATTEK